MLSVLCMTIVQAIKHSVRSCRSRMSCRRRKAYLLLLCSTVLILFCLYVRTFPAAPAAVNPGDGEERAEEEIDLNAGNKVAPRLHGDLGDYENHNDKEVEDENTKDESDDQKKLPAIEENIGNNNNDDDDNRHDVIDYINRNKDKGNEDKENGEDLEVDDDDNRKLDRKVDENADDKEDDNLAEMKVRKGLRVIRAKRPDNVKEDKADPEEDPEKDQVGWEVDPEKDDAKEEDVVDVEEIDKGPEVDKAGGSATVSKEGVVKINITGSQRADLKTIADEAAAWEAPLMPDKHAGRLLILAYMRTGSSMTGRILNNNPDVFYWYEPLHYLERYYVTGGKPESSYRNKTLNEWFKSSEMAGGNISATLACDIPHVYRGILTDFFITYGRHGTKPHHECFKAATTEPQWQACVSNMTLTCRTNFSATAVKSIRLHMAQALKVLARDPKVKVVHLIRDPRSVLNSRKQLGFADFRHLPKEASLLCGKYLDDLELAPKEGDPLRDRYRLVRYEDIVSVPLEFTRSLYGFLGLSHVPEVVLEEVKREMASVKKTKNCPTCPLLPLNATQVAQSWRATMDFDDVRVISDACRDALGALGYRRTFRDEGELRDLTVSSVEKLPLAR